MPQFKDRLHNFEIGNVVAITYKCRGEIIKIREAAITAIARAKSVAIVMILLLLISMLCGCCRRPSKKEVQDAIIWEHIYKETNSK